MYTLYIIRHGETDFNAAGKIQGRGIDSSLNERGREQAELFWRNYSPDLFDVVYCSTLKRTRQTIHCYIDAGLPCMELAALDEFNWGEVEGQPYTVYADTYRDIIREWTAGNYDRAPLKGESPAQVALRQRDALQMWRSQPARRILVCMHGRALRLMLCQLTGLPLSEMESFTHTNLSLYVVDWDGESGRIRLRDDRRHLSHVGSL
ncbi:MAG: histidine phosphatase family protein [Sphingomonadales bacterium]|nr:histidine phosphatase family protein [Sphingomonadales bacterium]